MGACGSLCDCLQSRARDMPVVSKAMSPREPIPNPFLRDDSAEPRIFNPPVYTILGKHPNGLTYGK